jgi:hypothetical protein
MLMGVGPLVKAQIRKGVSVIRPEWVIASLERRRPLPLIKECVQFLATLACFLANAFWSYEVAEWSRKLAGPEAS